MQYLMSCLCALIFISSAAGQSEKLVPIMSNYYLIGGVQDGKWLTPETVAPQIKDAVKMRTISLDGIRKNILSVTVTGEKFDACPDNMVLKFTPEIEEKPDWRIAVGENAKWDLMPRTVKTLAVANADYHKIVSNFLRTKGIARPQVKLDQVLQTDLDGDGQDEIIITGNFYKKGMNEAQNTGDYSFALLRKTVGGKAKNFLLEGDFFTKKGSYEPPNMREISVIADLNGDGQMEIVLKTYYYEGDWIKIFDVKNGKPNAVLEVSCII